MFNFQWFVKLALPAIKRQTHAAHRLGLQVLKHACGNNWDILEYFVQAGYDAYQAIQGSAGIDMLTLKLKYGRHLSLWGGVQVEILVSGTPAQVRREGVEAMAAAAPGGGYILGSNHSIANAARPENYLAMLETWRRYRDYPVDLSGADRYAKT